MGVTIDKNVPLPSKGEALSRGYPFHQMDVGDSFLSTEPDRTRLASAVHWFGARNGKKFTIRKTEGGFRVWRIA